MSDDAPKVGTAEIETLTFEQAQAELEQIVELLEDQHTGLDDALRLWERGEALHAYCQRKLDHAAQRIEKLQVSPEEAAAVVAEGGDDFAAGLAAAPAAAPIAENGTSIEPQSGQPQIF